jgi:polyisoprenoid-binding protein YceI
MAAPNPGQLETGTASGANTSPVARAAPQPGRYEIDTSRSAVTFRTRHMFGLAPVRGSFAIRTGTIDVAEPLTDPRIHAETETASFRTGNEQRDSNVRSARLLDAGGYPVMTAFTARATTRIDRTEFGVTAYRGLAGRYLDLTMDTGEVIGLVGLAGQERQKVRNLSGGQKRRLDLALGLIGDPELLFLDEPTTGFDPSARRDAWDIVRSLRRAGTTIVLTTHDMDEAQALAGRVAVISDGTIVAEGTPSTIGGRDTARARIRFALPDGYPAADLPAGAVPGDGLLTVETAEPTGTLHQLTGWALQRGLVLSQLTVDRPSLEDIYLRLTDHGAPERPTERSTR